MRDLVNKIPNVFLKLAYSELLLSYKTEELASLIQDAKVSSKNLLENVWQEDESVSEEDNALIIDGLARWLFARGENPDEFTERMFAQYKNLYSLPKRAIVRSYLPYISHFYEVEDQRHYFLELIEKRKFFAGESRFVCGCKAGSERRDFLINKGLEGHHLSPMDSRWIIKSIQSGPLYLDLPAFESAIPHSFQFTVEEALFGRLLGGFENDTFFVSGIAVGKRTTFGECLASIDVDLGLSYLADKSCVRVDTDVMDSVTGCLLLKKGGYYGAPVSISEFVYAANAKVKDPFAKLISTLIKDEFSIWTPVQKAHEALLHKLNHVAEVVYYEADDSISVNGKHLMRNVPARILRNVLREYTKTGREEFENREFKRDPEICIDPVNPNFESRLNRVVDHLEKVTDVMGLDRHRRGGFRFVPHCHIEFREEATTRKSKK